MNPAVREVDPFIGSAPPGNCLCGPFRPLALARLGPDSIFPQPTHGYDPAQPLRCFSHTHASGTGGEGCYGNIALAPVLEGHAPPAGGFIRSGEEAACGYYRVHLQPGDVSVELASTRHAGLTRFRFPAAPTVGIQLDLGAAIQVGLLKPRLQTGGSVDGELRRVSERACQGYGVYQGGWGHCEPYTIFFHAEFSRPIARVTVAGTGGLAPDRLRGPDLAVVLAFAGGGEITCAVGLSLVSAAKAERRVREEIAGRDIEALRREAEEEWAGWLARWQVDGGDPASRRLFHTMITRLLCMPTDLGVDDEEPVLRTGRRQFWDHYCLWDSFRGAQGWIELVAPELARDQMNAMVDVAAHTGWLPDAWIAGHHGRRQGGCPAAILLAGAALRGLPGVDYPAALRAMIADAETPSPDARRKGRCDAAGYRRLGRVSTAEMGCVSRTLEYAWHDAAIADLAQRLGDEVTAARYRAFASRIWELWREELQALAPRDDHGGWIPGYDPGWHTREPIWHDPYFYEGLGYDWTASLLFDLSGWRSRCGGAAGMERWLDRYWRHHRRHWKEIQMHIPWLYIEAGRPDKATAVAEHMRDTQYRAAPDGLRDNEDMGAHAAFFIGASVGLYPMPGGDRWWLSAPHFPHTDLSVGADGRRLLIEVDGPVGTGARIAAASFNGAPLNRAWLTHRELVAGGRLQLTLAQGNQAWGRAV